MRVFCVIVVRWSLYVDRWAVARIGLVLCLCGRVRASSVLRVLERVRAEFVRVFLSCEAFAPCRCAVSVICVVLCVHGRMCV